MVVDAHVEIELEERGRARRRRDRRDDHQAHAPAPVPPTPTGPPPEITLVPGDAPPPPPPRRGSIVAGAVAGGLLLVAVGFAIGRSGGRELTVVEEEAGSSGSAATGATTATTDPDVETPPALASDDTLPSSAAAERARDRRTTTTTTVPIEYTEIGRPLLDAPTGLQVVGVSRSGDLVEVDLDTGVMTVTELRYGAIDQWSTNIVVGRDSTFVSVNEYVYEIRPGQRPAAATGFGGAVQLVGAGRDAATGVDVFWTVDYDRLDGRASLVARDRDGAPLSEPVDLANYWPQGVDGRGRAIVRATGGTYAISLGGVERLTTGTVLVMGDDHLVVRECDEQLRCADSLVDLATGSRQPFTAAISADAEWLSSGYIGVSPDGSAVVVPEPFNPGRFTPRFQVVEMATGATTVLAGHDGPISFAWSDDSRFGLYLDGGDLHVLDRSTGTQSLVAGEIPALHRFVVRRTTDG